MRSISILLAIFFLASTILFVSVNDDKRVISVIPINDDQQDIPVIPVNDDKQNISVIPANDDIDRQDISDILANDDIDKHDISVVLVSGAFGYNNYATQADICHAYQLLLKGGISRENMVVLMAEDVAFHPENVEQGVIRHWDGGPNVYLGFQMDYVGVDFTLSNFEAVMMGDQSLVLGGSGRVLSTNPKSRVFFYFSSHGGSDFARFGKAMLLHNHLLAILSKNYFQRKYESMVIYASSCKSGSLFIRHDGVYKMMHVYVMTAATPDQSSSKTPLSVFHKTHMGAQFGVSWTKDSERYNRKTRTLQQQFIQVKFRLESYMWFSTPMQYGDKQISERTLNLYQGYDPHGPA